MAEAFLKRMTYGAASLYASFSTLGAAQCSQLNLLVLLNATRDDSNAKNCARSAKSTIEAAAFASKF